MTIGQVAKEAGLAASAIRFYEHAGVLPKPMRIGGRRHYDSSVLERLAVLERAKACGFSLAEARQLFYGFRGDTPPSQRWQMLAQRKIAELDELARKIAAQEHCWNALAHARTSPNVGGGSRRKNEPEWQDSKPNRSSPVSSVAHRGCGQAEVVRRGARAVERGGSTLRPPTRDRASQQRTGVRRSRRRFGVKSGSKPCKIPWPVGLVISSSPVSTTLQAHACANAGTPRISYVL
jgi:MerR family redox-sensitive transcriptional activator SoxR